MIDNKQPGQLLTLTDEHLEAIAAMTGHFISDRSHFSRALTEVAAQPVQLTMGNISDFPELQKLIQEKLENGTLHAQGAPDAQPEQTTPRPAQPDQAGEIAALRRDAERYRWLRSIGHDQTNVLGHYAGDAMDVAIDAAIAQPVQPATWHPTQAAITALKRFEETCSDGEGYDVPKETMYVLSSIGLIYKSRRAAYCITDFGQHILATVIAQPEQQTPVRQPLTDADIEQFDFESCTSLSFAENQKRFARAIEFAIAQPVQQLASKPAMQVREQPYAPDYCPITGRKFWGNIEHNKLGVVATYGGPFDTYTIPARTSERELRSERFDQDRGDWVDSESVGWIYDEQQDQQDQQNQQEATQPVQLAINDEAIKKEWLNVGSLTEWDDIGITIQHVVRKCIDTAQQTQSANVLVGLQHQQAISRQESETEASDPLVESAEAPRG